MHVRYVCPNHLYNAFHYYEFHLHGGHLNNKVCNQICCVQSKIDSRQLSQYYVWTWYLYHCVWQFHSCKVFTLNSQQKGHFYCISNESKPHKCSLLQNTTIYRKLITYLESCHDTSTNTNRMVLILRPFSRDTCITDLAKFQFYKCAMMSLFAE